MSCARQQRRLKGSARRLLLLAAGPLLAAAVALSGLANAQGISYTVQVVALSDRDAALNVVGDLLRVGYPAYVVRSTSSQGDVFRVRVGAFANRPAALLYANAMPEVSGGRPVPALAEAIPPGITPLAPRLVLEEDPSGRETRFLAFPGGGLALRFQWRVPLAQAEYVILRDGAVERVKAWQLVEDASGQRLRVRDLPLWPDTWQQDTPEVRQAFENNLLLLLSERLGVGVAEVAAARWVPPGDEVPRVIAVERLLPGATDGAELLGVGLPAGGMTAAGPIAYLGVDPGSLPGLPESARLDLAGRRVVGELEAPTWTGFAGSQGAAPEGAEHGPGPDAAPAVMVGGTEAGATPGSGAAATAEPGVVVGEAWQAVADGVFVRLTALDAATAALTSWRACVGAPLWTDGHYLLALEGGALLVYDFLPR